MKVMLILLVAVSMASSLSLASQIELTTPAGAPRNLKSPVPAFDQAKPKLRLFPKKALYSGALVDLSKSSRPLQLLNPFAPAKFGSGLNNLVIDSTTAKTKWIALFSVRY